MNKSNLRICVIGLGYVGLPTALIINSKNYEVIGVDINSNLIKNLKKNKVNLEEKEIQKYFLSSIKNNKIKFSSKPKKSDFFIICVPTPLKNNISDISSVLKAVESIYPVLKDGDTIIIESTCPVGSTMLIKKKIDNFFKNKIKYKLAYSPERVLPGDAFNEILNNDKIVGGIDEPSTNIVSEFFSGIINGNIHKTNSDMAELCKLVENSYRSLNIAFANELSMLCLKNSLDVISLIKLANLHKRVNILQPSIGVGGHCIPIDPIFLTELDKNHTSLISLSSEINKKKTTTMKKYLINRLNRLNKTRHKKLKKIICLGLSYKPDVGDLRESPAMKIYKHLKKIKDYETKAYEPHSNFCEKDILKKFNSIKSQEIYIKLVDHSIFKQKKYLDLFKSKIIIDLTSL